MDIKKEGVKDAEHYLSEHFEKTEGFFKKKNSDIVVWRKGKDGFYPNAVMHMGRIVNYNPTKIAERRDYMDKFRVVPLKHLKKKYGDLTMEFYKRKE